MCIVRGNPEKLIGERLKTLRETQGYTQAELADGLGVTETEVATIEEGKFSGDIFHVLVNLLRLLESSLKSRWDEHRDKLYLK
jgi:transcriptional regulator with XRE-family HTH domain